MADPTFVTSSKNTTPAGSDAEAVAVTIFPTVSPHDVFVEVAMGTDPAAMPSVVSVTASGATFAPVPGAAVTRVSGTRSARIETWRAPAVPTGITLVTTKTSASMSFGVLVGEYSTVRTVGHVGTQSGAAVPVTIDLATQDANNLIVAGFAAENLAGATFTGADTGTLREQVFVLGAGAVDVPGALLDNGSATPATVTNTVTTTAQDLWVAAAVELRSVIGGGFRSFQSLWFGPDAGGGTGATPATAGSFRSFQSVWFGPDGGAGVGAVTPDVTAGRKLISQGLAATIQAELT